MNREEQDTQVEEGPLILSYNQEGIILWLWYHTFCHAKCFTLVARLNIYTEGMHTDISVIFGVFIV